MQKHFNHYYLIQQIGSKPLRSAYLAHHVNHVSQKVLLKIFDATCLAHSQGSEQLLRQVEWIKQLRHAHLVPILDIGVEQGNPYVVSEYQPRGSLRSCLDSLSLGRLSFQEVLNIILQVGQALAYFHENAHLHQNIKPENIFFNDRNEVLLADFCLSGFIDVTRLSHQSDPRNMCYMAPEQFVGSASEKSDQYALACLTYELVAGRVPFFAQGFALMWASHYAEVPVPLSHLVPDLPKRIEEAVCKAMAKDPSERYPDIAAFLLALEGASKSTVPATIRPLSLLTFDSSSVGGVKSLKDRGRDDSITTSMAGLPAESSLASAPFGVNLSEAAFGTSLAGIVFDASLPGTSFGAGLTGSPFIAGLSEAEMIAIRKSGIPEKNLFRNGLVETSIEVNKVENKSHMSQKEDFLQIGENPFETSLINTPLPTTLLERWEHAFKKSYPDTNPGSTSIGRNHSDSSPKCHVQRDTTSSVLAFWPGRSHKPSAASSWLIQFRGYLGSLLSTVRTSPRGGSALLSQRLGHLPELWKRRSSDYSAKKGTVAERPAGDVLTKSFSVGGIFQKQGDSISQALSGQRRGLPTPALWFVLVISTVVLIVGISSYISLELQPSIQVRYGTLVGKRLTTVNLKKDPIDTQLVAQPVVHATGSTKP